MSSLICTHCGRVSRRVSARCMTCGATMAIAVNRAALRECLVEALTTIYLISRRLHVDADTAVAMLRAVWTEREPLDRPE